MTKSTITREQAQKIIVAADEVITALAGTNEDVHPDDSKKMCELWDDLNDRHAPPVVVRELARMALAAMDSESVELPLDYLQGHKDGLEWASQLAEANHPETGDWLYDDPIELAKAIRKGPDMPPAQPVADSEPVAYMTYKGYLLHAGDPKLVEYSEPMPLYADPRPEPISAEPVAWLLSGGGAKNVVVFDSGNAYADPLREVTPLYRHAQPAAGNLSRICAESYQVVGALAEALRIFNDVGVIKALDNLSAQELIHDDVLPFSVPEATQPAPVVSGWIPVSERLPEEGGRYWCYVEEQNSLGKIHYQWNCSWNGNAWSDNMLTGHVTHWMPLPAAPQEVNHG